MHGKIIFVLVGHELFSEICSLISQKLQHLSKLSTILIFKRKIIKYVDVSVLCCTKCTQTLKIESPCCYFFLFCETSNFHQIYLKQFILAYFIFLTLNSEANGNVFIVLSLQCIEQHR